MTIDPVVDQSSRGNIFSFLPQTLVRKCKHVIISYHELYGFSSLPSILWHPETHKLIKADPVLRKEFKRATSSRSAKSANEELIRIATVILATEILALGVAGWATRYPGAYKNAQALLAGHVADSRAYLTKRYLTNFRSARSRPAEAVPPRL